MTADAQTPIGLTEVTKDVFFQKVSVESEKGRDIHPSIVNSTWPYISDWSFHKEAGRPLFGRSIGAETGGTKRYFLKEARA